MKRWLAIWTKPRQEECARENLERQGFEALLPRVRERKRRGSRLQWCTGPLFQRYLFARADVDTQSIAPIRSTRGCVGPVRLGGHPAYVPEPVIAELREYVQTPLTLKPGEGWRLNQHLQVADGPLAGLEALFQARDGETRAHVLINWLGQWQRAKVPLESLEAAH